MTEPYWTTTDRWDQRFHALAQHVASWSKDPSTKVGCVLVNERRQVVGLGFNGLPRGVHDLSSRLNSREDKYLYTQHAEVNAVLQATDSTRGAAAYTTHMPCSNCAGVLIQAGIAEVYCPNPETYAPEMAERFRESFDATRTMFIEAGVTLWTVVEEVLL